MLEIVGVADGHAAGAAVAAAAAGAAHHAAGGLRRRLLVVVVVMVLAGDGHAPGRAAAAAATAAAVEVAVGAGGERGAGAGRGAAGQVGHGGEGRGRVAAGGGRVAVGAEAALHGRHGHAAHGRKGNFGVGCVQSSPGVDYCGGHRYLHITGAGSLSGHGGVGGKRRRHQELDGRTSHVEDCAGRHRGSSARLHYESWLLGWFDHSVQSGSVDDFGARPKVHGGRGGVALGTPRQHLQGLVRRGRGHDVHHGVPKALLHLDAAPRAGRHFIPFFQRQEGVHRGREQLHVCGAALGFVHGAQHADGGDVGGARGQHLHGQRVVAARARASLVLHGQHLGRGPGRARGEMVQQHHRLLLVRGVQVELQAWGERSCEDSPGQGRAGGTAGGLCLRLSFSSALSELSSRVWIPMGLELELEYSEELPSRGRGWAG